MTWALIAVFMSSGLWVKGKVGSEFNHTITIQSQHNHHTITTQSPSNHHTITTQYPHNHHAITTQSPRNHHPITTQSPRNHHTITTQSPRNHHTITIQSPHNHHAITTQSPHYYHTSTACKYHTKSFTTIKGPSCILAMLSFKTFTYQRNLNFLSALFCFRVLINKRRQSLYLEY